MLAPAMPATPHEDVTRVTARRRRPAADELAADLARLRRFSRFMDSQFKVAGVKFGADALIGLLPGVGDLVTSAAGLYPVYLAKKHGMGNLVIGRMLGNLALDFGVGLVPVLGDAADVMFKAAIRNRDLFEKAAARRGGPTVGVAGP